MYAEHEQFCALNNPCILDFQELDLQIVTYTSTYEPDDQMEWSVVLQEIKSFVAADTVVNILHADQNTIVLTHR